MTYRATHTAWRCSGVFLVVVMAPGLTGTANSASGIVNRSARPPVVHDLPASDSCYVPPGGPAPPCVPQQPSVVAVLHVKTGTTRLRTVIAIVTLRDRGPADDRGAVHLTAFVDHHRLHHARNVAVEEGSSSTGALIERVRLKRGSHQLMVKAMGRGYHGKVRVSTRLLVIA